MAILFNMSPPAALAARVPTRPPRRRQPEWLPISRLLLVTLLALLPRRAVGLQPDQPQQPHQGSTSKLPSPPHRVTIVGSGNFGSAVARLLGRNVLTLPRLFAPDVRMWVFEEEWEGRKLSEVINTLHENPKYLPGVRLPDNVVACPDLEEAAKDASILVFVVPHQFIRKLLPTLRACVRPGALAVSLIKGLDFEGGHPVLISDIIRQGLGPAASEVCVLMGANVADEVARDEFCEATIGCRDRKAGGLLQMLFDAPTFRVAVTTDPSGVELCGALKNVVALGAGFCDGLGYGGNTKAAVIRRGLDEMRRFCEVVDPSVQDTTFLESCGMADLITTCYGGRNRRCAERFARAVDEGKPVAWAVLEEEELGGQKLQGVPTAAKLFEVLKARDLVAGFPLFRAVYQVAFQGRHPSAVVRDLGGGGSDVDGDV